MIASDTGHKCLFSTGRRKMRDGWTGWHVGFFLITIVRVPRICAITIPLFDACAMGLKGGCHLGSWLFFSLPFPLLFLWSLIPSLACVRSWDQTNSGWDIIIHAQIRALVLGVRPPPWRSVSHQKNDGGFLLRGKEKEERGKWRDKDGILHNPFGFVLSGACPTIVSALLVLFPV